VPRKQNKKKKPNAINTTPNAIVLSTVERRSQWRRIYGDPVRLPIPARPAKPVVLNGGDITPPVDGEEVLRGDEFVLAGRGGGEHIVKRGDCVFVSQALNRTKKKSAQKYQVQSH